jgi:hypothetical protein
VLRFEVIMGVDHGLLACDARRPLSITAQKTTIYNTGLMMLIYLWKKYHKNHRNSVKLR